MELPSTTSSPTAGASAAWRRSPAPPTSATSRPACASCRRRPTGSRLPLG